MFSQESKEPRRETHTKASDEHHHAANDLLGLGLLVQEADVTFLGGVGDRHVCSRSGATDDKKYNTFSAGVLLISLGSKRGIIVVLR